MTRNRFFVWRHYCRTDTRYVAEDIIESQKELLKLLLFEQDRVEKLRAILAGLRDGLRGVAGIGPHPEPPAASTAHPSARRRTR
jgi:rhamnosyltransferase